MRTLSPQHPTSVNPFAFLTGQQPIQNHQLTTPLISSLLILPQQNSPIVMSRRPNPAADKASQNQQVIKSLLKLPGNKVCADCKRNKLPRWASWNLGVFVCIRCSGIHRGMGTHISRVKSVDLDSWTDEQLQSILKWGNSRANKYWEANLAPGHVPSEAKIENFVRTKYESKRWVMEGGIPDPATLEDSGEDDNLPLKVVQQKLENRQTPASPPQQPVRRQNVNLFDDDDAPPQEPARSNSVPLASRSQPLPKASPAPPKPTKPADSLLGLDFFAAVPTPAPRPASVNSNPVSNTSSSRPDLNRSILSLYASKPQPRPQHVSSPSVTLSQQLQSPSLDLGDLDDAFGGLGFGSQQPSITSISTQPTAPPPPKPSPFANLTANRLSAAAAKPAAPVFSFDRNAWASPAPPTSALTTNEPACASASAAISSNNIWSSPATSSPATLGNLTPTTSVSGFGAPKSEEDEWGAFSSSATRAAVNTGTGTSAGAYGKSGGFGGDDDVFANVWK
ncbi:ArfGap-domain-containing protein [Tuber magnatum]|uniref:ArfGap-domain-containing protein n=1 Tax=Tuber magnatum TaxID=42249 RepID=A0A317T251_9PEZI|nr:ArfGap-domain-containing protein [Tuber magnatum]